MRLRETEARVTARALSRVLGGDRLAALLAELSSSRVVERRLRASGCSALEQQEQRYSAPSRQFILFAGEQLGDGLRIR